MPERYEHLILPFVPEEFLREKGKGRIVYKWPDKLPPRDKSKFYETEMQVFDEIRQKHKTHKRKYKEYLDPRLIFKININQSVSEEGFRTELKRMDIEVISPSPDKKGYWVVFAEDEELEEFKKKLGDYTLRNKYAFFNAIDGLSDIPPEEKIGEYLQKEPFRDDEYSYLDVEIWRMDDIKLDSFLKGFRKLINSKNGKIVDALTTKNFSLLRVKTNKRLYEDILSLREVAHIDRPPKIKLETALNADIEELKVGGKPPEDATGVLVVDSGILPGHPLLEDAVGDAFAVPTRYSTKISEDKPYDDVGHGTQVAGVALYGNIHKCIDDRSFNPKIWIFSAKVMFKGEYGAATYDEEELLEHQLEEAVRRIVRGYPNCKVINLSLGDSAKRMYEGRRQFNLAALVDELSKELGVIFVVSAGNNDFDALDNYPDYLLDETTDRAKIINPATSAFALTVGALSRHPTTEVLSGYQEDYPSPITRVGPGYKGMTKPELVEDGGGGFGEESDVITINPNWIREGRVFTLVSGTSFSAPKVSNYIARLINKYPQKSHNLIKALLISSASIPLERPDPLSKMDISTGDAKNLLKIYGYGKPDLEKAIYSGDNRVLLVRENAIKPDNIHVYPVYLPKEFIEDTGDRQISVTLVFDPPVNTNRVDYLGTIIEIHLVKNTAVEEVIKAYGTISIDTEEKEIIPEKIKKNEIMLWPGVNSRKKGVHQKGIIEYKKRPGIDGNQPLVLVVICQKRWVRDENYEQSYAVVVSIEHSKRIDLYNQIRLRNRERVLISLKE